MSAIAEKVKKIVIEQLGVQEDQVTEDAKFIEDLGADSLDLVELIMAFEEDSAKIFPMKIPKNSPASAMPSATSKAKTLSNLRFRLDKTGNSLKNGFPFFLSFCRIRTQKKDVPRGTPFFYPFNGGH